MGRDIWLHITHYKVTIDAHVLMSVPMSERGKFYRPITLHLTFFPSPLRRILCRFRFKSWVSGFVFQGLLKAGRQIYGMTSGSAPMMNLRCHLTTRVCRVLGMPSSPLLNSWLPKGTFEGGCLASRAPYIQKICISASSDWLCK